MRRGRLRVCFACMLDLPDAPLLPKAALLGGCLRLPLEIDVQALKSELAGLPPETWGSRGGRVGVHRAAEAAWLRGFAPAEGDRPIEDRPLLDRMPAARRLIEDRLGGRPQRCLIARLPAGAVIAMHIDQAPYFAKTLRIHIPIETHEAVHMVSAGRVYRMAEGEAWVLNNSAPHAVWNADPVRARTHLICDFLPEPGLMALIAAADRDLGRDDPDVLRRVAGAVAA